MWGRPRHDPGLWVKPVLGSRSLATPVLGRPRHDPGLLLSLCWASGAWQRPYWPGRDTTQAYCSGGIGQQEPGNAHTGPAEVRPRPIGKAFSGQQEPGNGHTGPAEARPTPIGKASPGQQELGNTHIEPAEVRPRAIGKACAGQQEAGNAHVGPAEARRYLGTTILGRPRPTQAYW